MSRSAAVLLVLAVLAAAVLTACGSDDSGGSSTSDKAAAPSAQTSTQTAPAAPAAPAAATNTQTTTVAATPENNAKAVAKCHAVLDRYVTMLHKIKVTVDGTPKFKPYNAAVTKMVDYYSNKFNIAKIPSTSCATSVVQPVTGAYVKYSLASQSWTRCRQRQSCAAVMPDLKTKWKAAAKYLKSAEQGFGSVTAR